MFSNSQLAASALKTTVRRYYVDAFFIRQASRLSGRVLDLGGTKIRKRGRFDIENYGLTVQYANLVPDKRPDFLCDAAAIAVRREAYDAVICAELFEHVRCPEIVLREVHRVLKPAGTLLITAPFLCRIHGDPHDFGRYTGHFWQETLEEIGFDEVVIEPQGLFFSVMADFLKQYAEKVGFPRPFGRLARRLMPTFQQWALRREQEPSAHASAFLASFTTGFGISARKRSVSNLR